MADTARDIHMTPNEFLMRWTEFTPRAITREEAELLQGTLINILAAFAEKGTPATDYAILDMTGAGEKAYLHG